MMYESPGNMSLSWFSEALYNGEFRKTRASCTDPGNAQYTSVKSLSQSQTACSWREWNFLRLTYCSGCTLGALMGICVPSTMPRHRGKPLFCSNFCMISTARSPCGHRMKVFAQLSTSALQTLLTMRYTEDFVTLKRSDTDRKHSGLPSTQRVKSNCFSTLTGGLPLLCTVGIPGQAPSSLVTVSALCLDRRKWDRKTESV